jgi:hypothetical protein
MEIVIPLSRARECARNLATDGGRSPSPADLGGKELSEIIKDHFGIKPVQPAGGWVKLSFAGRALIDELQQSRSRSSHLIHQVLQSPTILVPEPGTRHLEEMAASQTPTAPTLTAPAQIEKRVVREPDGEEAAHEEPGDDKDGDKDSGYDSETKADSEDGEDHHKSTCDEVKLNADDCEHKAAESETTDISVSTNSQPPAVDQGHGPKLTVEVPPIPSIADVLETPAKPIDVSFTTSDDDDDDEFYDSPEGPDRFDAFSVP